jgi:Mrp family chromosome partitioning ATPase
MDFIIDLFSSFFAEVTTAGSEDAVKQAAKAAAKGVCEAAKDDPFGFAVASGCYAVGKAPVVIAAASAAAATGAGVPHYLNRKHQTRK